MSVEIVTVDQSTQIDSAISGDFEAIGWRNHPGGDPDQQYNWWKSGSPVNFGKFVDPEIDRLLDEGRTEPRGPRAGLRGPQHALRRGGPQHLGLVHPVDRRDGPDVHGVPGEGPTSAEPFPGLAAGHPLQYMWVEQ